MELYCLACIHHLKGCQQVDLIHTCPTDMMQIAGLKNAFLSFKTSASIFNYLSKDVTKLQHWKHPNLPIAETNVKHYEVLSTLSQAHGMMAAFEKGKRDGQNALFLAKIAKRV